MDWYWTKNSIPSCVPSGKTTEYSSSSWSVTSRRRWSDWILEIKTLSSERFRVLSALVWWNVEQQNGKKGGGTTRRMGQSRRADDVKIRWKQTPSLPTHESIISRSTQKQRWWKNFKTLLCWWGNDWNRFFAQLFLLISSVSTEQSQICVMNTVLVKQERWDPCWDNLIHCLCRKVRWWKHPEVPAQENLLQKYQERVDRLSHQNRVIKFCTDAGFLTTVDVGQYFTTKDTE